MNSFIVLKYMIYIIFDNKVDFDFDSCFYISHITLRLLTILSDINPICGVQYPQIGASCVDHHRPGDPLITHMFVTLVDRILKIHSFIYVVGSAKVQHMHSLRNNQVCIFCCKKTKQTLSCESYCIM